MSLDVAGRGRCECQGCLVGLGLLSSEPGLGLLCHYVTAVGSCSPGFWRNLPQFGHGNGLTLHTYLTWQSRQITKPDQLSASIRGKADVLLDIFFCGVWIFQLSSWSGPPPPRRDTLLRVCVPGSACCVDWWTTP